MSILIIEPSEQDHEEIAGPLRAGGYNEVRRASSFKEAYDMLGLNGYTERSVVSDVDLIIMDIRNEFEASEVCRKIKEMYQYQDTPIIMMAEEHSSKAVQVAFAYGATDFMPKPFAAAELLARVRGALRLKHEIDRRKARERELLEVTRQLSDLNQLLARLSLIDSLTNIPNRRSFDENLQLEWRRAARNYRPLSLIMLDVDYFKNYNDRLGHQAGDACLRRVANGIRDTLRRPGDFLSRYGGEEFAVILPDTDIAGAYVVAELIRENIESLNIPHPESSVSKFVTISLGVSSTNPSTGGEPENFVDQTDRVLYEAKRLGRNCVAKFSSDAA